MTERLELKAYGKINLGLDVVRKREDGYHEVRMIMQTVDLYDRITMERMESGIRVTANLPYVPDGEGNLAYRAAKLLMEEFGITEGISIEIKKMIPVAAGMAGGSTDAAAVLVGVNRMFGLGLTKKELMERGVRLGADVPYCILRGTALSEGIGEILTELPAPPPCTLVIAKPPVSVSTKEVYGRLDLKALRPEDHPDIDGMAEAIRTGDLAGITSRLGNVLELVTEPAHPEITRIKGLLLENGADGALMSGSGPTVFGMFKDRRKAERACALLREAEGGALTRQAYVSGFFNPGPGRRTAGTQGGRDMGWPGGRAAGGGGLAPGGCQAAVDRPAPGRRGPGVPVGRRPGGGDGRLPPDGLSRLAGWRAGAVLISPPLLNRCVR